MIVSQPGRLPHGDSARFAWSGLRRFHNVQFVADRLTSLQNPPASQKRNIRKQAEQIRFCLVQAEEYWKAAESVGAPTKPLLQYYSVMSLALAEILMKQDGSSSLDKARAKHSHHGLILRGADEHGTNALTGAASRLRAVPHFGAGGRVGTFELWHQTAREHLIAGQEVFQFSNGTSQTSLKCLAVPVDQQLDPIPQAGLSLLDCLRTLPSMQSALIAHGVSPLLARASADVKYDERTNVHTMKLVVHPGNPSVVQSISEMIKFHPSAVPSLDVVEMQVGFILNISNKVGDPHYGSNFPHVIQYRCDDFYFTAQRNLNEFGMYYVAMYILGNYARYFPDRWMADVEQAAPLASVAMELMPAVSERTPLLTLSELDRIAYLLP